MGGGVTGHDLFDEIISPENLFIAWREFRRGKRAKPDVQQFEFALEDNIFQLHNELANRAYRHGPYAPFSINDPKPRRIHKATVRDRLVHHAIFRILYPLFDRTFIYDSHSCRIEKGTHRAVKRLKLFARKLSGNNSRNVWALKCDVRRFFDSIDHNILLALIWRKISDESTIWLITSILSSFCKSPGIGLPLGNVTSQLFANIYLNELDRFIKHDLGRKYYLRYCDDFIVLSRGNQGLKLLVSWIAGFLSAELKLTLHPDKISVRSYRQGIDFLGYVVRPYHIVLRTKTKRRMFDRINIANAPSYLGILKHCNGYELTKKIKTILKYGQTAHR